MRGPLEITRARRRGWALRACTALIAVVALISLATTAGAASRPSGPKPKPRPAARPDAAKPKPVCRFQLPNPFHRANSRPCRPVKPAPGRVPQQHSTLPAFIPDHLEAELGDREPNGGRFGWAKLGAELDDPTTFTGPKGKASFALRGAPRAARMEFENGAAYRTKKYTVLQAFHGKSIKESIVVPSRLGKRRWEWDLTTPGSKRPRLMPNGAVDLGTGYFIPPPVVTSKTGAKLPAQAAWGLTGKRLWIDIDDAAYPLPYVIDPGAAPTVSFTGFSNITGQTYIDPAYMLTRIYINTSGSGSFDATAVVFDDDAPTPNRVCFPVMPGGLWPQNATPNPVCMPGASGLSPTGLLATYYSGSTTGNLAPYPGSAFTTTNYNSSCVYSGPNVGPFSRLEPRINSYTEWGVPGNNDDTPYSELCADRFSARWQGFIRTPNFVAGTDSNTHYFAMESDDGVRVTVDNTLVLAEWGEHGPQWHVSCGINLLPNTVYPITVDFFENGGNNRAKLVWRTPGSGLTWPNQSWQAGADDTCYYPTANRRKWTRQGTGGSTPWRPGAHFGGNGTSTWPVVQTPNLLQQSNVFTQSYQWSAGATGPTPAAQNIVVHAPDGQSGTTPFTVIADGAGPTGGTMNITAPASVANAYSGAPGSVTLSWSAAGVTDGAAGTVSGVNTTLGGRIVRQEAAFDNSNDTCDAFPATWSTGTVLSTGHAVGSSSGSYTTGMAGLATQMCYRWALVFEDNVGNLGAFASPVLRVDRNAPASLTRVLAEDTGTQWTHIDGTGNLIWFNSNGANTGTYRVTSTASDTGAGLASITFPGMGGGWSPAGATADTTSTYEQVYTFTGGDSTVAGLAVIARDAATNPTANQATSTPTWEARQDNVGAGAGTGGVNYLNGLVGVPAYNVPYDTGDDNAGGSGIFGGLLERDRAVMNPDGTCQPFPGTFNDGGDIAVPASTSGTNAQTLTAGHCYMWRIVSTDNVGNQVTFTSTNVLRFDDFPPTAAVTSFTTTGASYWPGAGFTYVWFRPSGSGTIRVNVNATDAIGMDRVDFGATVPTAGWTDPGTLTVAGAGPNYLSPASYSWAAGAGTPPLLTATAYDTAANDTPVTYDFRPDATAPAGGSAEPLGTTQTTATVVVNLTAPTETESGIATWTVQYRQSAFDATGLCTPFAGAWNNGPTGGPAVPGSANHVVASSGCYQYRLLTVDRVGNSNATPATSVNTQRVDLVNPVVAFTSPADMSNQGGTFLIDGTADDNETGVASVVLTHSGPGAVCAATVVPAGAAWTWSCNWASAPLEGSFVVTATVTDNAGRTGTATRTFFIDNTAPIASWVSWTEASPYLHADSTAGNSNRLWFHSGTPSGTHDATARVDAQDAGSCIDFVTFPSAADPNWTPAAPFVVNVTDPPPCNPMMGYTAVYQLTGDGSSGDPVDSNVEVTDNSGRMTPVPYRIVPDAAPPSASATPTLTLGAQPQSTTSFGFATTSLGVDADSGVQEYRTEVQFARLEDNVCVSWDPTWYPAGTDPAVNGNGASASGTMWIDDVNQDGTPEWTESVCVQMRIVSIDGVGRETPSGTSGVVRMDFGNPTAAITGPPNGSAQGGTIPVDGTADDGVDGGSWWDGAAWVDGFDDTGSGIDRVVVTFDSPDGPDGDALPDFTNQPICTDTTMGPAFPGAQAWQCPAWNTAALALDGYYTVYARAYDRAGRMSSLQQITVLIDNVAPIATWTSWTETSPWMHADVTAGNTDRLWYNPVVPAGGPWNAVGRIDAMDAGSCIDYVTFPAPAALQWTPTGVQTTNSADTPPCDPMSPYSATFTLASGGAAGNPVDGPVVVADNAARITNVAYRIVPDSVDPVGATADVVAGTQQSAIVSVGKTAGSDADSGLGSWRLRYEHVALSNDTCAPFTNTWTDVPGANGTGPAPGAATNHDVTALGSGCIRYQLVTVDNVGNEYDTGPASGVRKVDLADPVVAITGPPDSSVQSGTFAVTGTFDDAHTGLDHVRLEYDGPDGPDPGGAPDLGFLICDPATPAGAAPSWTFSCNWATAALPDGSYTVRAIGHDLAGRTHTVTITVNLDNNPPFVNFHSFEELAGSTAYTYWSGLVTDPLYFDPNPSGGGPYQFDVHVTATDPSGIDRVDFPNAGAGWTAPAATTAGAGPNAAPAANSYEMRYEWTSGAADPPTLTAIGYDTGLNPDPATFEIVADDAAPNGGTLTYTTGYVPNVNRTLTIATGTDTDSGLASWRVLREDGTLVAGVCGGWGAPAPVAGASGAGSFSGTRPDTVYDQACFRYTLEETDRVGNVRTYPVGGDVMVDLTPPSASVALTKGANPGYQYTPDPLTMYVNTNFSGSVVATVSGAAAASGISHTDFTISGTNWSGAGTVPGPLPGPWATGYGWTPGASNPTGESAVIYSNSMGSFLMAFDIIGDPDAPVAVTTSYTSGYTTGSSVMVTSTNGNDGTGSGIDPAQSQLQRDVGTLLGGACSGWSGYTDIAGATGAAALSYNDTSLTQGMCYRYRLAVHDNVANVGYPAASPILMVDQTPPTGATLTITEGTNPGEQYRDPGDQTRIFVNPDPTIPSTFNVTVTATDSESGTGSATFPTFGGTWTTTPSVDLTAPYTASYGWTATAPPTGAASVIVGNGSGLTTSIPFTVVIDGDDPTGATIDQENGFVTDFLVDLSYTTGNDGAGSGIGLWRIERRWTTYTVGTSTCEPGSWSAWAVYPSAPGQPASPHVDNTVVQPRCYEYRLVEIDNVGNRTDSWDGDTARVINDIFPPQPFNLTLPSNPALPAIDTGGADPACTGVPTYGAADPNFEWTPSDDFESGLLEYRVYIDGMAPAPHDATVAAGTELLARPPLADGAHGLGVRAYDNQSNFTNAGPGYPTTIRIDNAAPTAALSSPANAGWTMDTTPTLTWAAGDANCLARVEVYFGPIANPLTTPVAVAGGLESTWTSPLVASGMYHWRVEAIDSLGNRTSSPTWTFGIDVVAPDPIALSAPTAGQTVRGFVDVAWNASGDADSGLAGYRVYTRQGMGAWVLRATNPAGDETATISPILTGAYEVYVEAFDNVGNITPSAPVAFTGFPTIPAPVLVSPGVNASINALPNLTWSWPSDGGPTPTDYDVQLGPNVPGLVNVATGIPYGTWTHALADPGDGWHEWRVVQHDPYTGTVNSTTTRRFLLDRTPPNDPGALTRVGSVVSWPAVSDPAAPVASGIDRIEFWINDGGGWVQHGAAHGAGATSHSIAGLPDGIYDMHLVIYDNAGNSTTSTPDLNFVNDSTPPTAFTLNAPANGVGAPACATLPTYLTGMPTLTWTQSTDITSGLAGYDVYMDGSLIGTAPDVPAPSFAVPPTLAAGAHSWHVIARDNFGLSTASTPNPLNVRVDIAAPNVALVTPADNSYTADTTPQLDWAGTDDNCLVSWELYFDGSLYGTYGPSTTVATIATPQAEGAYPWYVVATDSAGRTTTSPTRTLTIDLTPPTAVNAVNPANGGSLGEGMLNFTWSAATDALSGMSHYDIEIDGTLRGSNITGVTTGPFAIYAGPHTWRIRAYDNVGNSQWYGPFTFTATPVPDVTAPDPFNLLTPADAASVAAGTPLTWEPAWDFHGIANYRVFIDGNLVGTTPGNVTTFTPSSGAGSPICAVVDYDPATSTACITGPTYSRGKITSPYNSGFTAATDAGASVDWASRATAGWSASGNAWGLGTPSTPTPLATDAGFDGDRVWTAMQYTASVPASGADLRFEHRYSTQMQGASAFDGGTVEVMVDDEGNGFGDDPWESTCLMGAKANYGTSLQCVHEIVRPSGGFNAVLAGPVSAHPLAYRNVFAGNSSGVQQTTVSLAAFSGMNVRFRFRLGTNSCWVGQTAAQGSGFCAGTGVKRSAWHIDNVTLANPSLLPGPHLWYIQAVDPSGNTRNSNQTWTFNLL